MESPFILLPASVNKTRPLRYSSSDVSNITSSSSRNISRNGSGRRASRSARFAELCGVTTAECTAIFCCCPCCIVELLVVAIYKVPANLCSRALRFKQRRWLLKKKSKMQPRRRRCQCGYDETDAQIHPVVCFDEIETTVRRSVETEAIVELEKEMWHKFYGGGFWRSISQREPPVVTTINI